MGKKVMGVCIASLVVNLIFLLAITGEAITIKDKNKNYTGRFEIIRKYVTDDVYNALKGPGDITTPKANFQNEVKNLDVYITTHDNKTIKALVNITTLYSMGGAANKPINQIYELELKEQEKDQWIITNYTLMGNFAPYSTNQ